MAFSATIIAENGLSPTILVASDNFHQFRASIFAERVGLEARALGCESPWYLAAGYWARVRERWEALLWQPPGLRLKTGVDGMELIMPLFEQAGRVEEGEQVGDAEIDAAFDEWVEPVEAGARAAAG